MSSENPSPAIKQEDIELWDELIQNAEPLPNPKRGLFKFHNIQLRMPKRGADGKVTIYTDKGDVFFQGALVGPLLGSESRLVHALNRKVQEIQNRSSKHATKSNCAQPAGAPEISPVPDKPATPGQSLGHWREFSSTFAKMDLERRIQQLDVEDVPRDEFISNDGTSVTATVVKAEKSGPTTKSVSSFFRDPNNLANLGTFETWSRAPIENSQINDNSKDSDCQKTTTARDFSVNVLKSFGESVPNSVKQRTMIMLHDYVTFQGSKLSAGQSVSFVMKGDRGWAQVIDTCGIKCWVPFSYLEDIPATIQGKNVEESHSADVSDLSNKAGVASENHPILSAASQADVATPDSATSNAYKNSSSVGYTRDPEWLAHRVEQLEKLADVQLVLELQRELRRERQERDAERRALENDIVACRGELNETKERIRLLELRANAAKGEISTQTILREEWKHEAINFHGLGLESKDRLFASECAPGAPASLHLASNFLQNHDQELCLQSLRKAAATEVEALARALENEQARGAAWQETTEELMVQNERLRECIQEQQAALVARGSEIQQLRSLLLRGSIGKSVDGIESGKLLKQTEIWRGHQSETINSDGTYAAGRSETPGWALAQAVDTNLDETLSSKQSNSNHGRYKKDRSIYPKDSAPENDSGVHSFVAQSRPELEQGGSESGFFLEEANFQGRQTASNQIQQMGPQGGREELPHQRDSASDSDGIKMTKFHYPAAVQTTEFQHNLNSPWVGTGCTGRSVSDAVETWLLRSPPVTSADFVSKSAGMAGPSPIVLNDSLLQLSSPTSANKLRRQLDSSHDQLSSEMSEIVRYARKSPDQQPQLNLLQHMVGPWEQLPKPSFGTGWISEVKGSTQLLQQASDILATNRIPGPGSREDNWDSKLLASWQQTSPGKNNSLVGDGASLIRTPPGRSPLSIKGQFV